MLKKLDYVMGLEFRLCGLGFRVLFFKGTLYIIPERNCYNSKPPRPGGLAWVWGLEVPMN